MSRRRARVAIALAVVGGAASAAAAQTGDAGYRDRNVWAAYREPPVAVDAPVAGLPRTPARWCLRLPLPNQEAVPTGHGTYSQAEMRELAWRTPVDRTPGAWHTLVCYEADAELPYLVTLAEWIPRDPTSGNGTTIEGVEAFARDLLVTPAPAVATSPPADRQVTGLETWFAAAAPAVVTRSAQAGPLWATAEAVATAIELDPGDGTAPTTCPLDAPGTVAPAAPVVAPACLRHTYRDVARATGTAAPVVRLRVRYSVYVTTSDAARRPVDDLLGDPATIVLTVREIQTVLR